MTSSDSTRDIIERLAHLKKVLAMNAHIHYKEMLFDIRNDWLVKNIRRFEDNHQFDFVWLVKEYLVKTADTTCTKTEEMRLQLCYIVYSMFRAGLLTSPKLENVRMLYKNIQDHLSEASASKPVPQRQKRDNHTTVMALRTRDPEILKYQLDHMQPNSRREYTMYYLLRDPVLRVQLGASLNHIEKVYNVERRILELQSVWF